MKRFTSKKVLVALTAAAVLIVAGIVTDHDWIVKKETSERNLTEAAQQVKGALIDAYFEAHHMPLKGYGLKMVQEGEENGLDWRLLPAIAIRESSGGIHSCGANVFGWASCKRTFKTTEEAIETVALHLGGNATSTRAYYGSKTTEEKLRAYNPPSIVPTYVDEVLAIMEQIAHR